jgi:hypothetical protein
VTRLYQFPAWQAGLVASGRKRQTIRRVSRPNAKPGDPLHLFSGRRRLVDPPPVCLAADRATIALGPAGEVQGVVIAGRRLAAADEASLAHDGGFQSVADMGRFYFGLVGPGDFEGVLIRW